MRQVVVRRSYDGNSSHFPDSRSGAFFLIDLKVSVHGFSDLYNGTAGPIPFYRRTFFFFFFFEIFSNFLA
jgi:hypothetical protein